MYTLQQSEERRRMAVTGFVYLIISLLCAVFGMIYEHFSHEVYSGFMIYAFLFPLTGGTVVFNLFSIIGKRLPKRLEFNLYNSGIAALTVGSIFSGVLEIYGTTNRLVNVYWYVGPAFSAAGIIIYMIRLLNDKRELY